MNRLFALWETTVGKKVAMAATGIVMIAFEHLDRYAAWLRSLGPALWIARAGLLAAVTLHITAAYQLAMRARRARPIRYDRHQLQAATYASRTMRWGDSWSGRAIVRPVAGLEVQGSLAHVHSPESRPGAGPDADKVSVSARWDNVTATGERYALVEYARTSELNAFFVYHSLLAEGMLARRRWRVAYRFESTERPEEVRLVDQFRSQRPSPDNSILGISRWSLHTLHIAYDIVSRRHKLELQPFVEGTLGQVARVGAGIFDPRSMYGTDQVRALNVGVLVGWGMRGHRMGRYGALSRPMDGMAGMTGMTM